MFVYGKNIFGSSGQQEDVLEIHYAFKVSDRCQGYV